MALPNREGLNHVQLVAHLKDVSTGTPSTFVRSPVRGRLTRVKASVYVSVSGTAETITTKINTTTVSGGTLTLATGGAAGAVYSATTTNAPLVQQGDVISFNSAGNSDNSTNPAMFMAIIRKI